MIGANAEQKPPTSEHILLNQIEMYRGNLTMIKTKTLLPMIALLALGSTALTGCTRMGGLRARMAAKELAHQVQIQGDPITVGRLNAIVIDNPYGKVKVYAKSMHEEASISFRVDKERQLGLGQHAKALSLIQPVNTSPLSTQTPAN